MAGLNHQACGVLDLASAARCPDRALLSKHSNQNEKPDLGQESDAHDRDRKEHVARRERVHECLAPSEAPGVNHSGEGGLRPPAVQPVLTAFIEFPDNHPLEMLALRTSERQKVGMGGTRFDPGQHHPALTLRAAWPIDGKQGWVGMTIGFRHDASPALGGSATLSVTGRCRYEGR
jgi:hypothetical protein